MNLEQTSLFRDFLILIGFIPMQKPKSIDQQKKRMGYPKTYLIGVSRDQRKSMKDDVNKLYSLL